MSIDRPTARVRLVFADRGEFHTETIQLPLDMLAQYERLVDLLREEPSVTRQLYVDRRRLAAAFVLGDDD